MFATNLSPRSAQEGNTTNLGQSSMFPSQPIVRKFPRGSSPPSRGRLFGSSFLFLVGVVIGYSYGVLFAPSTFASVAKDGQGGQREMERLMAEVDRLKAETREVEALKAKVERMTMTMKTMKEEAVKEVSESRTECAIALVANTVRVACGSLCSLIFAMIPRRRGEKAAANLPLLGKASVGRSGIASRRLRCPESLTARTGST